MMTRTIDHSRLTLQRARVRAASRGVTLFEVLIVVAILAMVAGGVAMFALPQFKKASITQAESGCRVIRQAVQTYLTTGNGSNNCPTVSQLVEEKLLDRGTNTNDPWNQPFTISCADDEVYVTSSGPDKRKGTKDDISVPPKAATNAE